MRALLVLVAQSGNFQCRLCQGSFTMIIRPLLIIPITLCAGRLSLRKTYQVEY